MTRQLTTISRELRTIGTSLSSIGVALGQMGAVSEIPLASATARARRSRPARRNLSAKRRAALKLQGRYMGHMRLLKPRQKARVKSLRETKGVQAAITLARRLSKR